MVRVAIAVVVLAISPAAWAQSADAEALFRQGLELEASGKTHDACEAFAASNVIEQRAGTLLRLGACFEKEHKLASAWAALSDALARAKDPAKKRAAQAELAALESRLSYLTVSVPADSQIQGLELARDGTLLAQAMWNRAIPVDGGKIEISGRAPGHERWTTTVEVPTERGHVNVDVPRFKELAKLVPPPPGGAADPRDPGSEADDEHGSAHAPAERAGSSKPRRYVAYGLVGGGAVLGLAAVGLEVWSRSKLSQARSECGAALQCSEPTYSHAVVLLDGARTRQIAAIATGAVGVASIGIGVYLYIRARRAEHVAVVPSVDHDAASLALIGSF